MSKFIEVTEIREPIGVEQIINHNTLLNVDQIVSIQSVEPRIAEALGYNTTIVTTKGNYNVTETMAKLIDKILTETSNTNEK